MPRRMGILALLYLKIGLLNVKKKSSLLHVDFLIPLGLSCYLLCGLDQLWLRCVNRQNLLSAGITEDRQGRKYGD